jgi:methionine-gamma-lyase
VAGPPRSTATPRAIDTRVVHPPVPAPQAGVPLAPQLDPSSTYAFDDVSEFALASSEKVGAGYVYARWANPTVDAFEAAVADLEGAEAAEAFASGMAAISAVFLALCGSGDRVVSSRALYGNAFSLLADRLPRYGIEADLVGLDDFEAYERALPGAKALYVETIANPRVTVPDLPRLAALAARHGVPLVVDNTFASPLLCRPLELGAAIVVHSATKFLGGHHDLLGGVVCASEEALSPIRAVARDLGPTMSPFTAWLGLRGMQTLHLRVDRSCANALRIADALASHPQVAGVAYPALEGDESKDRADDLLGGRGGGVVGFDVSGGRARAARFQQELRLVHPAASVGGTHTLVVHAASVTHTQLTAAQLAEAGLGEGFCRLSVGLEDPADVIEDLRGALDRAAA